MSETTVRRCNNFKCDHNFHDTIMICKSKCFTNGTCELAEIRLECADGVAFCAEATNP